MWRGFRDDIFDDMWSSFRSMQRDLDSLFRRIGQPRWTGTQRQLSAGEPSSADLPVWSDYPPANVWFAEGKLHIRAEVPGIEPKNLEVTVTDEELVIRGTRTFEHEDRSREYVLREFGEGRFERRFRVPGPIGAGDIKASYDNGVLEITLPASEGLKPRKIQVQVSGGSKKTIEAA